jgi:YihY family inner membrane protein
MVFRMWNDTVGAEIEKLWRVGQKRVRVADIFLPSIRYIFQTESHAYAFSIAANALLSFYPSNLILLAICRRWLHWEAAYQTVLQLLRVHLPAGGEFVIRNLETVVQGRPRLQLISVFMLFFTTSGVFLPLEIALNKVWGFQSNRSFLKNQGVCFLLAVASGLIALTFILAITPVQASLSLLTVWIPSPRLLTLVSRGAMEITSIPMVASLYFLIYYFLPHGKVSFVRVFPAAIVMGILMEVGKGIYFLTLPMFRFREVYGPFELSVTLLFWAYLGALILLFGAHLSAHIQLPNEATPLEPVSICVQSTGQPENTER